MKKLVVAVLAGALAGCATVGDVESAERKIGLLEEMHAETEKNLGEAIARIERLERDLKALNFRISDLQKELEKVQPRGTQPDINRIWQDLEKDGTLDPVARDRAVAFLKDLGALAPEKAHEEAVKVGKILIPQLIKLLREKESPSRNNALFILQRWDPNEAAAVFEPFLADGSVRAELVGILNRMPPGEEIRKALLKHAEEGTDGWRVTIAEALLKAHSKEGMRRMIAFLYHEDSSIRTIAIQGLKQSTGFDLGYKQFSPKEDRVASAEKWEQWWKQNEPTFDFPNR